MQFGLYVRHAAASVHGHQVLGEYELAVRMCTKPRAHIRTHTRTHTHTYNRAKKIDVERKLLTGGRVLDVQRFFFLTASP